MCNKTLYLADIGPELSPGRAYSGSTPFVLTFSEVAGIKFLELFICFKRPDVQGGLVDDGLTFVLRYE